MIEYVVCSYDAEKKACCLPTSHPPSAHRHNITVLADSKLNVQLFIATHSIEAIDAILRYGNYENNNSKNDPIKVITLKKVESDNGKGSNIAARNVTGKYVYDNRKVFEFEVRL